jgi:hypothetical protein
MLIDMRSGVKEAYEAAGPARLVPIIQSGAVIWVTLEGPSRPKGTSAALPPCDAQIESASARKGDP